MEKEEPCGADHSKTYGFIEFVSYFLFAVGPLVGNAVLVLLGAISNDFMINPTDVLIAIPAFMFPFAFFQLFSGALSDIYGRVPIIALGLIGFAVGLVLTVLATTIELFALGNFISGIGFGFVNPVLLALLSDCARPEDIPKRMGIASALASLSVGLGPFIAGQMVVLGWQSYYLMFILIVILGLIAIVTANRPPKVIHGETGVQQLVSNLNIELRRPIILLLLITTFMVALTYLGVLVWTSRGLTGALNEGLIGIILLGGGIAGAIMGSSLGSMIRRFGFRVPISIGLVALLSGVSLLVLVGDITLNESLPFVQLGIIIVAGAGGLLLPIMITYSQILSPERRGVLAGSVTFAFFLGSAVIPSLYEPLFHLGMTLLYLSILIIGMLLVVSLLVLYKKAT